MPGAVTFQNCSCRTFVLIQEVFYGGWEMTAYSALFGKPSFSFKGHNTLHSWFLDDVI